MTVLYVFLIIFAIISWVFSYRLGCEGKVSAGVVLGIILGGFIGVIIALIGYSYYTSAMAEEKATEALYASIDEANENSYIKMKETMWDTFEEIENNSKVIECLFCNPAEEMISAKASKGNGDWIIFKGQNYDGVICMCKSSEEKKDIKHKCINQAICNKHFNSEIHFLWDSRLTGGCYCHDIKIKLVMN